MADAAATTLDNPPTVSALELHEILVRSHATANLGRKRLADGLRVLADSDLARHLGFPNVYAYAEATFRYRHTQTHELIQVSRRLLSLPLISGAYERGELTWHLVAKLAAVAAAESEAEWLQFLERRRVSAVIAELEHCKQENRTTPRQGSFGLPGLPVRVSFKLSPEEYALFVKGIDKVRSEITQSLDGERPEPKEVLLVLMRRLLETDPEASMTAGRNENGLSPFTVVVNKCPCCERGAVDTEDGRVELEPQALERIESEAQVVVPETTAPRRKQPQPPGERDKPNTPALRRAVCQRDGGRCSNPFCRRHIVREGHCHHIDERALGGATTLSNETFLCAWCHACYHAGLLKIERDPVHGGLVFTPVSSAMTKAIRSEIEAARGLPEVRTVEVERPVSGCPDAPRPPEDHRLACLVLEKLGFTAAEARRRLEMVIDRSPQKASSTSGELVQEALKL